MNEPSSVGKNLTLTQQIGRGGCLLKLSGVIDESLRGAGLIEGSRGIVILDLGEVNRITSYGVREWMHTLKALRADSIFFVNLRPALVSQFNMVANFGCGGQVVTLYSPFNCPACGKYFEVLVDLRTAHGDISCYRVPAATCPDCRAVSEFDDVPESYFAHVAAMPAPTTPALFAALLTHEPEAFARPFKAEKRVEGNFTFLWLSGALDRSASVKRLADGLEGVVIVALDVDPITPEGLARFAHLTGAPGIDLFLARMLLPLAHLLVQSPGIVAGARVASLLLPFSCAACGTTSLRERRVRAIDFAAGTTDEILCDTCLGPLVLCCEREDLKLLESLPTGSPPDEAMAMLQQPHDEPAPEPAGAPRPDGGNGFGRYELVRKIGAGGMAEVFLARMTGPMGFEKRVVLKRILPHLSAQKEFIEMFLQEARISARISHPNVVQIFDLGQVGTQYFLALEYVKGWDLSLLLRLSRQLGLSIPLPVVGRILMDVCAGLHAAHTCTAESGALTPIIHRDISPQNVLVSSEGIVKITDFGIAKAAGTLGDTQPGMLKGKIAYMAPELISDLPTQADGRADVFAAGAVLYQCVTLEPLFRRDTEAASLQAILQGTVPRMSWRRPDVPVELETILDRAVATAPAQRYSTALEFQQALHQHFTVRGGVPASTDVATWLLGLQDRANAAMPDSRGVNLTPAGFTPTSAKHAQASLAEVEATGTANGADTLSIKPRSGGS